MAKKFGISLGGYRIELVLSRAAAPMAEVPQIAAPVETPIPVDPGDPIALGYAKTMEQRFPALRDFGFTLTPQNAIDVGAFYADFIPLLHAPSRSTFLRNLLQRLRQRSGDAAVKAAATRAIALSDMADGLPDRATVLKGDAKHGADWEAQVDALEAAYGAALVREDWSEADRGNCLIAYFEAHPDLLRGKDILHLGPETSLRAWFDQHRDALGIGEYRTADAYGAEVDENHDITAIAIPTGSFDVVICHRVMEHVLDDQKGFAELFRVLRPGGFLSFSVPQAPHRPDTAEWVIPDETHHGHVRHYGVDLETRMRQAGFRVELESWLTGKSPDALRAVGAYPMRIYNAWRDSPKII